MTLKSAPKIGLEAFDQLILIAVLLCSVGISLNGTFNSNMKQSTISSGDEARPVDSSSIESSGDEESCSGEETASNNSKKKNMVNLMFQAICSIIPFFINTLSLFGLSGEIYANDTSVVFFVFGLFISVLILAISGILGILGKADVSSPSSYLEKRYNSKTASYLVAGSAIVRHVLCGALNVHVASLAAGTAIGISGAPIAFTISVTAAFCVSVGGIQTEHSYSIGNVWLVILTATSFVVLCMTTSDVGGIAKLIEKSQLKEKIAWPSISPYPWEHHSYWGTTILGMFLGLQIFLLSRASLKHLVSRCPNYYYLISSFIVWLMVVLWVGLATWAGLCSAVTFSETSKNNYSTLNKPPNADGSLTVLIAFKLHHLKGFRGFFLASLIAATISGLTRRFNQMIAVLWESWNDICGRSASAADSSFSDRMQMLVMEGASEDFIREMKWNYFRRKSWESFLFKAPSGIAASIICIGVLWILQECNLGSWELWQGIVGVISGSIIGALMLGFFFPCFPHMSVVLGLLIGWCLPCYLVIGNISRSYQPQGAAISYKGQRIVNNIPHKFAQSIENQNFIVNTTDPILNKDFFLQERHWLYIDGEVIEVMPDNVEKKSYALSGRNHNISQIRRNNILHTSYCYYGLVGMLSSMVAASLFTAVSNRCQQKEFPPELLHPLVHIFLLRPRITSAMEMSQFNQNNRRAFAIFQEKAGQSNSS